MQGFADAICGFIKTPRIVASGFKSHTPLEHRLSNSRDTVRCVLRVPINGVHRQDHGVAREPADEDEQHVVGLGCPSVVVDCYSDDEGKQFSRREEEKGVEVTDDVFCQHLRWIFYFALPEKKRIFFVSILFVCMQKQ